MKKFTENLIWNLVCLVLFQRTYRGVERDLES